jgi:hypothetical protein
MVGQERCGRVGVLQLRRRKQGAQVAVEVSGGAHAPGGEEARQQRVDAGLRERALGGERHPPCHDDAGVGHAVAA